jgi:hypothetical protein
LVGHDRILCELRDDGRSIRRRGAILQEREHSRSAGRLFPYMDLMRTPREMAIQWAEEWRKAIETDRVRTVAKGLRGGVRSSPPSHAGGDQTAA